MLEAKVFVGILLLGYWLALVSKERHLGLLALVVLPQVTFLGALIAVIFSGLIGGRPSPKELLDHAMGRLMRDAAVTLATVVATFVFALWVFVF